MKKIILVVLIMILFQTSYGLAMPPHPDKKPKDGYSTQGISEPRRQSLSFSPQGAVTGSANILVIPIQFTDKQFQSNHSTDYFQQLITGPLKSMKSFYEENSYGKFTISAHVSPVVTSDYTMAYYGGNENGEVDPIVQELAREAVQKLDDQGFDFSPYDEDGDGELDHLYIIHAGYGEEELDGTEDDIWSHQWSIHNDYSVGEEVDGIWAIDYCMVPETGTVGVFVHEFGHDLGLPDLYDYDHSSAGIGDWDVMGGGSWNALPGEPSGSSPAHFSIWSKLQLGWISPMEQVINEGNIQLLNIEDNDTGIKLKITDTEYFLIENRQKAGFDEALPGHGALIWHVDEFRWKYHESLDTGDYNDNEYHPLLALEQADGYNQLQNGMNYGDGGDPYPGIQLNTSFDDASYPSSKSYAGTDTNISVTDILETNGIITMNIQVEDAPVDLEIYDLNGDGDLDLEDLTYLSAIYNTRRNIDSQYEEKSDLNTDGIIDLYDLVILSKKFNF